MGSAEKSGLNFIPAVDITVWAENLSLDEPTLYPVWPTCEEYVPVCLALEGGRHFRLFTASSRAEMFELDQKLLQEGVKKLWFQLPETEFWQAVEVEEKDD